MAEEVVSHSVKPLPKQLGQKYGNRFPALRDAILQLDPEDAARAFAAVGSLRVSIGGEVLEVLPEDVEIRAQAKEGFAVAEEGPYVAALLTAISPELAQEGLAREFVRRVQDLRKAADLDVADRIELFVEAGSSLRAAVEAHREYVVAETLTTRLVFGQVPTDAPVARHELEGDQLTVGLVRA
jgi:isoleucyl-tRNA synthetase